MFQSIFFSLKNEFHLFFLCRYGNYQYYWYFYHIRYFRFIMYTSLIYYNYLNLSCNNGVIQVLRKHRWVLCFAYFRWLGSREGLDGGYLSNIYLLFLNILQLYTVYVSTGWEGRVLLTFANKGEEGVDITKILLT